MLDTTTVYALTIGLCTPDSRLTDLPPAPPRAFVWVSRAYTPLYRRTSLRMPLIARDVQYGRPGTHAWLVPCARAALGFRVVTGVHAAPFGWPDARLPRALR